MRLPVVLLILLLLPQMFPQTQDSPRNTLDPRTYAQIANPNAPIEKMEEQLHVMDARTISQLDSISRQHIYLLEQQKVILEQLQVVLEIRKQVYIDGERVANLEARFQRHEDRQLGDPQTIAVLSTKVDAIIRLVTWLACGVGSLILGAIGFLAKRHLAPIIKRRIRL